MWNAGYVSEVDYLYGYYPELSPQRLKLALLSRGIQHSIGERPNYLELGFGQGVSLNINAATSEGQFFGTDFNPAQAAHARELAEASEQPVRIFDHAFEELMAAEDLPQFDIISLHGIWSWISAEGRQSILDILHRKLKPGGILYMSYNVTPGWSSVVPLRHLMTQYARTAAKGDLISRVDQSIEFVEKVIENGAAYFGANPALAHRLEAIKKQDRYYVAHEYFNACWDPMPFSAVAEILESAKLGFAASANIWDNIPMISTPEKARPILAQIDDVKLRETTRDYFINQQFRRDVFARGVRVMSRYELLDLVGQQYFMLLGNPADTPTKIVAGAGEASLRADIYGPLTEALASRRLEPISVAEIEATPACKKLSRGQIWEALLILMGQGFVASVQIPASQSATPAASRRLNAHICKRAQYSGDIQHLAAPLIGSALPVNRIEQLFLHAINQVHDDAPAFVRDTLVAQEQRLVIDGKEIADGKEIEAQARKMFGKFSEDRLSVLKAVGAV
ncbi:class I SAM-dependent methyltransferase [Sphingobium cloacae]|uniref:Methyltransferase family protein n=1 Tax=Sphingobium cloacae TaxID=120107 RepID=A0A1E1F643_9SPHN|nr:class I SAM-dependent methyltransferase [Sphingobium cloacae]BAV65990.1 methyltransferase family protein [Sphingobium cloacae]